MELFRIKLSWTEPSQIFVTMGIVLNALIKESFRHLIFVILDKLKNLRKVHRNGFCSTGNRGRRTSSAEANTRWVSASRRDRLFRPLIFLYIGNVLFHNNFHKVFSNFYNVITCFKIRNVYCN